MVEAGEVAVAAAFRLRTAGGRRCPRRRRGSGSLRGRRCRCPRASGPSASRSRRRPGRRRARSAAPSRSGSARREAAARSSTAAGPRFRPGFRRPSPSRCCSWSLIFESAASRSRLASTSFDWRFCTAERALARASRSAAIASRADSIRSFAERSLRDGSLHLVAELADPLDHGFVHAVDPFQILGWVDQLVVAVGADDHAQHVRGPGLVDRDEPLAQRHQGAFQPAPDHREVLLGDIEFGDGFVEFGLLGVEPLLDRRLLGRAGPRPRPSAVRSGRGSGRSSSSARPARSRTCGELRFLVFEFRAEILGRRGGAGEEQHDQRRRGGQQRRQGRANLGHGERG